LRSPLRRERSRKYNAGEKSTLFVVDTRARRSCCAPDHESGFFFLEPDGKTDRTSSNPIEGYSGRSRPGWRRVSALGTFFFFLDTSLADCPNPFESSYRSHGTRTVTSTAPEILPKRFFKNIFFFKYFRLMNYERVWKTCFLCCDG